MIHITLPDGSRREFPAPVTVAEVAASIGAGLAKAALAGLDQDALVAVSLTDRPRKTLDYGSQTRHSPACCTTGQWGRSTKPP
jgi:hypothetical protein